MNTRVGAASELAVIAIYLASLVAIGLWAARRQRTSDDFMASGRRMPGWAVGLSIFGTYVSSISFLAIPSKAYASNWMTLRTTLPAFMAAKPSLISPSLMRSEIQSSRCSLRCL